ncbi:energy transducer TonB [Pontibacter silvestris]|uniref:Energy transducer TonB n=1 Tax=Pontibacter silvestris TaxID=2305183 RepID=A0ABW4WZW7_9BACT|nr:energy transducer TonB [Pontibacter silvestris]MCC9135524.1 energy transducer TonB [Pontibacter silvestris]
MKKPVSNKILLPVSFLALSLTFVSCSKDEESAAVAVKQQEEQQATLNESVGSKPYTFVEQMPEFRGGEEAMLNFLGTNIKYPEAARNAGVEGLTIVSFVVEKDGTVSDIATLKSLSPETDQEAKRVVKQMSGNWKAGKQAGELVRVQYTLPIRFAMKEE